MASGGALVSITSDVEYFALLILMGQGAFNAWSGGHNTAAAGVIWPNGNSLRDGAAITRGTARGEDCVLASLDETGSPQLFLVDCTLSYKYICQLGSVEVRV